MGRVLTAWPKQSSKIQSFFPKTKIFICSSRFAVESGDDKVADELRELYVVNGFTREGLPMVGPSFVFTS